MHRCIPLPFPFLHIFPATLQAPLSICAPEGLRSLKLHLGCNPGKCVNCHKTWNPPSPKRKKKTIMKVKTPH